MDEITIERARRGDRDAMAAVLNGLADVWFRFSLSQLRNPDLARDATQETAVRFMQQLGKFRGDSKIESWSLGIAINVIREHHRKAKRFDPLQRAAGAYLRDATGGRTDDAVIEQDEFEQINHLLDGLPERQREAIVLRFFEEKSVEETARAMNCAEGTIKATVHQALRALRTRLMTRK